MNDARRYEQEARDRTEVAVAEATASTQADMLHEFFMIEQVAEHTVPNQQMEILNWKSLAQNAISKSPAQLVDVRPLQSGP